MALKGGGKTITFSEVDEVNHPIATIIYSEPSTKSINDENSSEKTLRGRIDIAHPPSHTSTSWSAKALRNLLIDVFLPAGYPQSVTDDYVPYQIFDSLQAFSSSIAGLLSSRAVLQGVGVGNADASPTSALLLHILQDSSGRIATILFAHRVGTALEPECKMYRLAADVFNDLAMILDCLSPMIPAGVGRVTVLSTAGILRALCGVAGGSSKASLSAHFSRWGNLAEVNAKDSSQETVISLIGMLVGSFVVSHVTSYPATWLCLLILLTLHLSLNYAAVRSVQMTTLNRQRANIVFSTLLTSDSDINIQHLPPVPHSGPSQALPTPANQIQIQIPTPAQVSLQESIFQKTGILSWAGTVIGTCEIGVSLQHFLLSAPSSSTPSSTPNSASTPLPLSPLTTLFKTEPYLLFLTKSKPKPAARADWKATIILKTGSTAKSHLKAWTHALLAARMLSTHEVESESEQSQSQLQKREDINEIAIMDVLARTLEFLNAGLTGPEGPRSRFEGYVDGLERVGWEVDVGALETRSGRRVEVL